MPMLNASQSATRAGITSRWTIASLVFIITVINFADRGVLGVVAPMLMKEFHLTIKQFGIIGSGFGWGYTIFAFLSAKFIEKLGAKRTYMYFALLWSFFVILFTFGGGFLSFMLLRTLFGASEGVANPAGSQLLGAWFPAEERGKAVTVMPLAVPLGTLLITPFAIPLALAYNWRIPFIVLGILGPIWVLFCKRYISDAPPMATRAALDADFSVRQPSAVPWSRIVRSKSLWMAGLAAFASAYFLYFLLNFLPLYLVQEKHIELSHIAYMSMLPWLAMAIGAVVSGSLSDYLYKKTGNLKLSRSYLAGSCLILCGALVGASLFVSSVFSVICLISFASFINFLSQPALFAMPIDLFPDHGGPAMSLFTGIGTSAGILAPLLTGLIVNGTGSFYFAFVVIGGLPVLCGALLIFLWRPVESSRNFEAAL